MYTMLFKSPSKYYYYKSSDRGVWNRQLMRRYVKGKYTLYGNGHHWLQEQLAKAGCLTHSDQGHIIDVEDSKDILWFKMNHEKVGNYPNKMMHIWQDLDKDLIEEKVRDIQECYRNYSSLDRENRNLRNNLQYINSLNYFFDMSSPNMKSYQDVNDKIVNSDISSILKSAFQNMNSISELTSNHSTELTVEYNLKKKELTDYVNSCKLGIG